MQFLPAKALKLLENVLKLKIRKLQKILLKACHDTGHTAMAPLIKF